MKAKKIIIAIVAILAVLGATFAGLWFFTDVFNFLKPANEVFANQLGKALKLEGTKFSDYSDFLDDYKFMSTKSTKSKINMTTKLNLSTLDSTTQEILNNSKISIESINDVKNKNTQSKLGLYSKDSEVLSLDLISQDNKIAIGSSDLYDKYVTLKTDDLLELAGENSEFNLTSTNMSLNNVNAYDLLYISKDDLKYLDKNYKDCLKTMISKDCYTSEKNVEVDVDGDKAKTTAYYLTLTGKDAYETIENFTNKVKDDSVIAKLIADKMNLITGSSKYSENDSKDLMKEISNEFLETFEDLKNDKNSAIRVAIYSRKNKPVRIDVLYIYDINNINKNEKLLSIEYADKKEIYTLYTDGTEAISVINKIEKCNKKEHIGQLTIKLGEPFHGMKTTLPIGTIDYEIVNKNNESKLNLNINMSLLQIYGKINLETKGNFKKEPVNVNGLISLKYGEEYAEIKFDGSDEYGDFSTTELTSENSIDYNDLLKNNKETEKLYANIIKVLPNRLKLLGIDLTNNELSVEDDEDDDNNDDDETVNPLTLFDNIS